MQALSRIDEINIQPSAKSALRDLFYLLNRFAGSSMPANELLDDLLKATDLLSRFNNTDDPQNEARKINIGDFVDSVEDFAKNPGGTLSDFMTNIAQCHHTHAHLCWIQENEVEHSVRKSEDRATGK